MSNKNLLHQKVVLGGNLGVLWYNREHKIYYRRRKMVRSLLNTTQNTRDLGGYKTKDGVLTRYENILRSDVQNYPSEEDFESVVWDV